jgi:endogenous inhibitor of DNA gyrase (YacG/DUF329 family)
MADPHSKYLRSAASIIKAALRQLRPPPISKRKVCVVCSAPFYGRYKRVCSDGCRYRWLHPERRCVQCGVTVEPRKHFCQACYAERRKYANPTTQRTCAICDRTFIARIHSEKGTQKYCSKRCHAIGLSRQEKPHRRVNCPRCGVEFWPWKDGTHARKYCSKACAIPPKQPTSQPPNRTPTPCAWCGTAFIKKCRTRQRFCSFKCYTKASTGRKHLRKRHLRCGEVVSLPDIYARDKGICQLCHKRVKRGLPPLHAMAATLDHIVPIDPKRTRGQHTRANVQLAHRACNSAKGNRRCGSQLRLF